MRTTITTALLILPFFVHAQNMRYVDARPIFITYSMADILLQVTTDKGIGDYIDDASESLMGGNSIYSW